MRKRLVFVIRPAARQRVEEESYTKMPMKVSDSELTYSHSLTFGQKPELSVEFAMVRRLRLAGVRRAFLAEHGAKGNQDRQL